MRKLTMQSKFLVFVLLSLLSWNFAVPSNLLAATLDDGLNTLEDWGQRSRVPDFKQSLYDQTGIVIQPYFRSKVEYTSNVFQAPQSKDDVIWTYVPGFKAVRKDDKMTIGLAYESAFDFFSKNERQNQINQDFSSYVLMKPTDNSYIRVGEQFSDRGSTAGDKAFEPIDFFDNTVNVSMGFTEGDYEFKTAYENFNRHFKSSLAEPYSYNENRYDPLKVYKKLNDDIRVFTGYRLGTNYFPKKRSRDTTYHEFPVGLEGKLLWGIVGSASIGYHFRNLESGARNDVNHVVCAIELRKAVSDRTTVMASFTRRPVESAFENQTVYDEKIAYFGVNHLVNEKLRGRFGLDFGSRDFQETTFGGPRFAVGPGVFVSTVSAQERKDDFVSLNLGMDYILRKWFILNMDYRYSRRSSNISTFDMDDNRLSIGSTIPI